MIQSAGFIGAEWSGYGLRSQRLKPDPTKHKNRTKEARPNTVRHKICAVISASGRKGGRTRKDVLSIWIAYLADRNLSCVGHDDAGVGHGQLDFRH